MCKDFEDTDREGTTMDSRKPLTAGAEELIERIETALALHNEGGPLASTPMKIPAGAYRSLVDAKRLLSLLTPPPDAAVREAVEFWADAETCPPIRSRWAEFRHHALVLIRAVQAPRLDGKQVEAVRKAGVLLDGLTDEYPGHRDDVDEFKAAFPEAFAWEVGE